MQTIVKDITGDRVTDIAWMNVDGTRTINADNLLDGYVAEVAPGCYSQGHDNELVFSLGHYHHFTIGGWDATAYGREVAMGPLVQGPRAYGVPCITGVTAHRQAPRVGIKVSDGDTILFMGARFRLTVDGPIRPGRTVHPALTAY